MSVQLDDYSQTLIFQWNIRKQHFCFPFCVYVYIYVPVTVETKISLTNPQPLQALISIPEIVHLLRSLDPNPPLSVSPSDTPLTDIM